MNKSIIILGILAVMFTNPSHATTIAKEQQNQEVEFAPSQTNSDMNLISSSETKIGILNKPEVILDSQSKIIESVSTISTNYKKSIEEIIAEDKKIIESNEETYLPLYYDSTIEKEIKLNNQIIESNLSNEVYPLDFDLINKLSSEVKVQEFKNSDF